MLALSASVSPIVAGVLPADGATKTFSATGTEWTLPANWTPAGVPTSADDVLINAGSADVSLTATNGSVSSITFSSPAARVLGNATGGSADSILTLSGAGTSPMVSVLGGTFTIAGSNIDSSGLGSGRLGIKIQNTGTWNNEGFSRLVVSADISDDGASHGITKTGSGVLELQGHNSWTGEMIISPKSQIAFAQAGQCATSRIQIQSGAQLTLDNSAGDLPDRISDAATIEMNGGSIEMIGSGSPAGSSENLGTLRFMGGPIVVGGHDPLNRPAILNFTADFTNGRYVLRYATANGTHILLNSPPALQNGIIDPRQNVNGSDWATINAGGEVIAYTGYNTNPNPATWSATDNVAISVPAVALSGLKEYNTIKTYLPGDTTIFNDGVVRTNGILAAGSGSITGSGTITATNVQGALVEIGDHDFTIAVPITDNGSPVDLIKGGGGTLTLDAPNTMTGNVFVNEGTLQLSARAELFDSYIHQSDDGVTIYSASGRKTIGGLSGGGTVLLGSGTLEIGSNNSSSTFAGSIISSGGGGGGAGGSLGSVRKVGEGTLTLTGANHFGDFTASNGRTRINDLENVLKNLGLLTMGSPVTPGVVEYTGPGDTADRSVYVSTGGGTLDTAANISMSGVIFGPGTFTKAGSGTLTLTAVSTLSSVVDIQGGTVAIEGSGSLSQARVFKQKSGTLLQFKLATDSIGPNTNIEMAGGTFEGIGGASAVTKNVGLLVSNTSGQASGASLVKTSGPNGTIRFSGADFEGRGSGTIDFSPATIDGISFVFPPTLTNGIIGTFATFNGSDWATISGSDHHVAAYTAYNTDPNPGTWGSNDNVALNIPAVLNGNTTIGSLKMTDGVRITINGSNFFSTQGIIATGVTSIGGSGTVTANYTRRGYGVNTRSDTLLTMDVPITDNDGPVDLIKSGEGTLVLGADNSYTGDTIINAGTLRLAIPTSLRHGGRLQISAGGTLDVNGQSVTVGELSGDGEVDLGVGSPVGGGGSLTIDQASDSTFHLMRGNGDIVKLGVGKLTVGGSWSHTGQMSIQGGTLVLGPDGSLPNTSLVHIAGGAAFILDGTRSHDDEVIKGYRLNPLATIEMDGGELSVVPNRAADPGEQVLGPLHLLGGAARVTTFNWTQVSGPFKLSVSHLIREPAATLYVALQPGDEDPQLTVVNPPTMTNGIIGGWAVASTGGINDWQTGDWAIYDSERGIRPLTTYNDNPTTWNAFVNGRYVLKAGIPLRFDANSLKMQGDGSSDPSTLTLAPGVSVVTSGGILSTDATTNTIAGPGSITSGGSEMFVAVPDRVRGKLVFVASIVNNGGTVSVIKSGEGTAVLSGANTFTGPAIVQQGTLELAGLQPLGGDIVIHNAATLRLDDGVDLDATHHLAIGDAQVDVPAGATAHIRGGIMTKGDDVGILEKTGDGTLELSGINTYTGGTTVSAGRVVNKGKIVGGININNGGKFTLDVTSPPAGFADGQLDDDAPITMNGGTFEIVNGSPVPRSEWIGALKIGGGITLTDINNTITPIHVASLTRSPGATLNVQTGGSGEVYVDSPPALNNDIIGDWAIFNGTDWATIDSATRKMIPITQYETSGNSLIWSPKSNVLLYGSASITSRVDTNTLKLSSGVHLTLTGQNFFSTSGIIATGSSSAIEGTGTLTAPAGASEIVVHTTSASDVFRIDTPIADNGAPLTLIKAGDGTVELHHPGTYTGETKVARGVLKTFFEAGDKPTQSQFSTLIDSTLDVSSGNQSIGSLAGEGSVVLGSSTLSVGSNGQSTSFSGEISGAGGLTKLGDGTFTLTGASTYAGVTTIDGGTLVLGDGGSLPNSQYVKIKRELAIDRERKGGGFLVGGPAPVEVEGGTLEVKFGAGLGRTDVTDVQVVYSKPGSNQMTTTAGTGTSATVRIGSLSRDEGSNLNWNFGGDARVTFTSPPALDNGIIGPWATVNSLDWATIAGDDHHVAPFHAYQTNPDPTTWVSSDNVDLSGDVSIITSTEVNTVRRAPAATPRAAGLAQGVFLRSGGILDSGDGDSITGPGSITAKSGASTVTVIVIDDQATQPFVISAPITNNGNAVGLVKSGRGTLSLTATNSYSGSTIINEGTLLASSRNSLGDGSASNSITLAGGTLKSNGGTWPGTPAQMRITSPGGTIDTNGSNMTFAGDIASSGTLTKTGSGTLLLLDTLQGGELHVGGGKAQVGLGNVPNTLASRVSGLTINAGATLDLTAQKLVIQNGIIGTINGDFYTGITGLIQSGRNGSTTPLWDGSTGIVTSQSLAMTGNYHAIAVARASDVRPTTATATALWSGQSITGDDILVMYTYGGDATLDGKLNIDDYVKIDTGIASALTGWSNGDFNYDGKVNIDDYTTVIDANIANQNGIFPTAAGATGVTSVPEPAIGGTLFLLGSLTALRRRRRSIGSVG